MTYCSRTILIRKCYLTGQAFTQHSQEKTMEKPYLCSEKYQILCNLRIDDKLLASQLSKSDFIYPVAQSAHGM